MEATIVCWGFRTWLSERQLREIGHGVAELEVSWGQTASEGGAQASTARSLTVGIHSAASHVHVYNRDILKLSQPSRPPPLV